MLLGSDSIGVWSIGETDGGSGGFAYGQSIRSGVGFPSYTRAGVWSSTSGWAASYPVTNVANLEEVRRVAVHGATGAANLKMVLPEAVPLDFIAFIHHNAPAAATFRVRLSAGIDPTVGTLYDSGQQPFWPTGVPNEDYPPVRPFLFPLGVTARSIQIDLSTNAEPWELGGVEVAQFWHWPDINVDRAIGMDGRSITKESGGGISYVTDQFAARIANGKRAVIDQSEADTTLLDFQRFTGRHRAFVWAWNMNSPASWIRESFLAMNRSLPGGVVTDHLVAAMRYDFREHLG